jgi:hypothetical protein
MRNERVYVKTSLFEGWATVVDVFPDEMYPIQVKLDEGDEDGHRIKRISKDEIIKREELK